MLIVPNWGYVSGTGRGILTDVKYMTNFLKIGDFV